jgi:hypothetical protein
MKHPKHLLISVTAVMAIAATGPVWAQAYPPGTPQAGPPAAYPGFSQACPFPAPTPRDAYRQGIINRYQLEQYEGPTPQALQGPSVDGGGAAAPSGN